MKWRAARVFSLIKINLCAEVALCYPARQISVSPLRTFAPLVLSDSAQLFTQLVHHYPSPWRDFGAPDSEVVFMSSHLAPALL